MISGNPEEKVMMYRVGEADEDGNVILFDDFDDAVRYQAENGGNVYLVTYNLADVEMLREDASEDDADA